MDGIKIHSQESERSHDEIMVTITDDEAEAKYSDIRVNDLCDETAEALDNRDVVADDVVILNDAKQELNNAMLTKDRRQQLDIPHFVRTTGFKLWDDEKLGLKERMLVVEFLTNWI